jgi:uncharacterized protein with von Willebrand factor type A (vWA) domain
MPVTRFPARARGPADRLAGFVAHLRLNGLPVGPAETAAALAALTHVNAADATEARMALRAVCTGNQDEFARFDDLFAAWWLNRGRERVGAAKKPGHRKVGAVVGTDAGASGSPDSPEPGTGAAGSGTGRLVAARAEALLPVDLRELVTPEDIAAAEAVARRLAAAIRDRRSRRRRIDRRGATLDLRRIARASVATGGEPLRLFRRHRPDRPARIVALADVSGSMSVYARVFLAFLRGLMSAEMTADAYLFHTRLIRITDALRDADTLRAVGKLTLMAEGFGGGTRIAGALEAFNAGHAARAVNGRTLVLILSDGYDTDPPERLAAALAGLSRRGPRIVWLNPLKGWRDYQPVARGMQAALPYLDLFAPANTLASLAALEPQFRRL